MRPASDGAFISPILPIRVVLTVPQISYLEHKNTVAR